tara:strand:+ start:17883 stop:18233 length:351 start_codon:yes stop_codon:yes gene_type:complete
VDFYPFYKSQHQGFVTKLLHFIGTGLVIVFLLLFFVTLQFKYLGLAPLAGYGFAWVGHFFLKRIALQRFNTQCIVWLVIFGFFGTCCEVQKSLNNPILVKISQNGMIVKFGTYLKY